MATFHISPLLFSPCNISQIEVVFLVWSMETSLMAYETGNCILISKHWHHNLILSRVVESSSLTKTFWSCHHRLACFRCALPVFAEGRANHRTLATRVKPLLLFLGHLYEFWHSPQAYFSLGLFCVLCAHYLCMLYIYTLCFIHATESILIIWATGNPKIRWNERNGDWTWWSMTLRYASLGCQPR